MMSSNDKRDQATPTVPNRRSILLGTTSLATASLLGSGPLFRLLKRSNSRL
jgi:hypothetical protein